MEHLQIVNEHLREHVEKSFSTFWNEVIDKCNELKIPFFDQMTVSNICIAYFVSYFVRMIEGALVGSVDKDGNPATADKIIEVLVEQVSAFLPHVQISKGRLH